MPHCKVCGNPVSREETECRICGSKLNIGVRRIAPKIDYTIKRGPGSDSGLHGDGQSTSWKPPVYSQEVGGRTGLSKKTIASILALAIVIMIIGVGAAALLDMGPQNLEPIITPPSESLAISNFDNHTIKVDFINFGSSTSYSDCRFRISIGTYDSSAMDILTWQSIYISSQQGLTIDAFFVDVDDNGIIDGADYCVLSTQNVPEGLQCSIAILNANTGSTMANANFAF